MNMRTDTCRLCGGKAAYLFNAVLLREHDVAYFECPDCRYVQTEHPYWLYEAYEEAINLTDTGILRRNLMNARIVQLTLSALDAQRQTVVDFAGGYGILVRQLRDVGVNALWRDEYCKNLLARGFEHAGEPAVLATSFEAFEHFVDPVDEALKIQATAPNILISTELMPDTTPHPDQWWYYGLDHGQHIGFFRLKSLRYLAGRLGVHLASDANSYHLLSAEPVNESLWRLRRKFNLVMLFRNVFHRDRYAVADFHKMLAQVGK